MAMNPNTYTVKKGDTLSGIAQKYRSAYNSSNGKSLSTYQYVDVLAAINNIPNKNKISTGEVLDLEKKSSGSSGGSSSKKMTFSKRIKKRTFGLQADVDNSLLATWYWEKTDKKGKNLTQNFSTQWRYRTANKDKDGNYIWFYENKSDTDYKYSTFSIPEEATRVQFRAKPNSKTYKKKVGDKEKELTYFEGEWSDWSVFDVYPSKIVPPEAPSQPSISIKDLKLTATLDGIDSEVDQIKFQLVKNNSTSGAVSKTVSVKTAHAEHVFTVAAGNEYKVRCQAIRNGLTSEWSAYSSSEGTRPIAPKEIIQLSARSSTSVELYWTKVSTADSYDVEYTSNKEYFDSGSDEVGSKSFDPNDSLKTGYGIIDGIESGSEYFFRVRATNQKGSSTWCPIKSIKLGKTPVAPTTWASTTTVITGEPLTFFWVHNVEDGSLQTFAELELIIGSETKVFTLSSRGIYEIDANTSTTQVLKPTTEFADVEDGEVAENKTNSCIMDTSGYIEGTKIQWRIRTSGITNNLGDWSVQRTVDIYARPGLVLRLTDKQGADINVVESFPFYFYGLASPTTQIPTGYHLLVSPKESYDTVDELGNEKFVSAGSAIYSKNFDTSEALLVEMSAGNIDLQNGIEYVATCTVSMNSGLTAEDSVNFSVSWVEEEFTPNAEIGIDNDAFYAVIRPYCEESTFEYHKVTRSGSSYVVTEETLDAVYGEELEGVFTTTGEQVCSGTSDEGDSVYYCAITESTLVENVTLSVYRREFDGSFTEIATELSNTDATFVTDPHPALDYARYRIVATSTVTGAVSYYDIPIHPVGGTSVIIQWDEEWTDFFSYGDADDRIEPSWSGSLLKLPYNIDVSDKTSPDVALVSYIGRKRPVSYFGTQLGETSTWNVVIKKDDEETIYALRRLSIWAGNAYVREPSGTGYWAKVGVSFSQKHNDLTIPVTLDITRVEGGM